LAIAHAISQRDRESKTELLAPVNHPEKLDRAPFRHKQLLGFPYFSVTFKPVFIGELAPISGALFQHMTGRMLPTYHSNGFCACETDRAVIGKTDKTIAAIQISIATPIG
jgi:hypothetical protein